MTQTEEQFVTRTEAYPDTRTEEKPAAQAEEKPAKKFSAWGIAVWVLVCAAAAVAVYGIVLSLTNYRPAKGISGSEWVGFQNYERVFNMPGFLVYARNSLVLRAAQTAAGLVFGILLTVWAAMSKKPGTALTKACLCLVPMCLPTLVTGQAVRSLLPREFIMEPGLHPVTFALAAGLQTGGFFGFCGGLFQYLGRRGIGRGARQGLFIALLISCLSLLTPNLETSQFLSHAINRETSMTLDLYAYQMGLQNGQFSVSSAVAALKGCVQWVLGIVPAVILCRIAKKDESRVELPDARGNGLVFTFAQLVWIGALVLFTAVSIGIASFSANQLETSVQVIGEIMQNQNVWYSVLNSVLTACLGGAAAGFAAYAFIAWSKQGRKGFGLAALILACSLTHLTARYLLLRQTGLMNTLYAGLPDHLYHPWMISLMICLAIALRMAPERRGKGLLLGLLLIAAALKWGEFFSTRLYISSRSLYTLPLTLLTMLNGSSSAAALTSEAASAMTEAQLLAQQAYTPIVTLLTGLPAVLLAFGGAACFIRAFKEAK